MLDPVICERKNALSNISNEEVQITVKYYKVKDFSS